MVIGFGTGQFPRLIKGSPGRRGTYGGYSDPCVRASRSEG